MTVLLAVMLLALGLLVGANARPAGSSPRTAVPLALAGALAASLVVNDSPNDVLLVGLASYLAADRGMLPARWVPGSCRSRAGAPRSRARRPSRLRRRGGRLAYARNRRGHASRRGDRERRAVEAAEPPCKATLPPARRSSPRPGAATAHVLADAGSSGTVGPNLDDLAHGRAGGGAGDERRRRDARLQRRAERAADRRRRHLRRRGPRRLTPGLNSPLTSPARSASLRATSTGRSSGRTAAAAAHARCDRGGPNGRPPGDRRHGADVPLGAAIPRLAGIVDPVVCYQGAVVADPASGAFLLHEPIPLELAREAIAALEGGRFHVNCYVGDELYVAEVTPEAEQYASFQKPPDTPGGQPARLAGGTAHEARHDR